MARCWTCGSSVSGHHYTCNSCDTLTTELKGLQGEVAFYGDKITEGLDYMAQIQQEGFTALSDTLSAGLSEIASAIEWGFGELSWQLQQQTDVLRSIDHTLKTPSETQANEWREMAEKLRRRGVLDESEEFYLKALDKNRLDYRIYVGLAETYLQINEFDKAKTFLEKSLPHAPKKEIDYRSYSYRLIGHTHACEEDYSHAVSILRTAIELSPTYEDGHYDYAQYCAQMRNTEDCLSSLQKAILAKPLYWYLAQKERNFDPVRSKADKLLSAIRSEALSRAKGAITESENVLSKGTKTISEARQALHISKDKAELQSSKMYEDAEVKLKLAKDKIASGDYIAFLEAVTIAKESHTLAKNTANKADEERRHYEEKRAENVKNAWKNVPLLVWWSIIGIIIGTIGGCTTGYAGSWVAYFVGIIPETHSLYADDYAGLGFFLGGVIGLIIALSMAIKEIRKALK